MNFTDKTVLLVGSNSGIGTAVGQKLVNNGAKVCGIGYKHTTTNNNIDFFNVDISNYQQVKNCISDINAKIGGIDILINCAGITRDALTWKMSEEQFDEVINVNLKGVWNVTSIVGPQMMSSGHGSIVNVSSVVGIYGNIGQTNYAASKAGLIGMTKSWAKEFAYHGSNVRANVVVPGYTNTNMIKNVPESVLNKIKNKVLLGRFAEPEEIANVILFLASDMASYITGTVVYADGGIVL